MEREISVVGMEPTALRAGDVPSELGAAAGQRNEACVTLASDERLCACEEDVFREGYQTVLPSPKLTLNTLYSKRAKVILVLPSGAR